MEDVQSPSIQKTFLMTKFLITLVKFVLKVYFTVMYKDI